MYDEALILYNSLKRRQESRYLKKGKKPGILYIGSSKLSVEIRPVSLTLHRTLNLVGHEPVVLRFAIRCPATNIILIRIIPESK